MIVINDLPGYISIIQASTNNQDKYLNVTYKRDPSVDLIKYFKKKYDLHEERFNFVEKPEEITMVVSLDSNANISIEVGMKIVPNLLKSKIEGGSNFGGCVVTIPKIQPTLINKILPKFTPIVVELEDE